MEKFWVYSCIIPIVDVDVDRFSISIRSPLFGFSVFSILFIHSAAGVTSVTIINHPTEGLLFAGEEKLCRKLKELVAKEDIDKELMEESMRSGNNLNHSCTRGDKEELMSKVYDCLLPPLPMPFSEFCNSPTTMLYSHFSRVLEVEMAGLRYKGGPLPEKIFEWFKWDQSIFNAIRGATYHKTLPGL